MTDAAGCAGVLARQAIHDALMRYCRGIDRCDPELVSSAYHPDAIDHHGGVTTTGAAAGELLVSRQARYLATLHCVHNEYVELDLAAAQAHCETYFTARLLVDHNGTDQVIEGSGRYVDRFECRDGDWRIAERWVLTEMAVIVDVPVRPEYEQIPAHRSKQDLSYHWGRIVGPSRSSASSAISAGCAPETAAS